MNGHGEIWPASSMIPLIRARFPEPRRSPHLSKHTLALRTSGVCARVRKPLAVRIGVGVVCTWTDDTHGNRGGDRTREGGRESVCE